MRKKLLATALLMLFGCHPVANAAPDVSIEKVVYAGSGCPAGSLDVALDDADTELVLSYDQLIASAGPGVPVTETRKLCEAKITLHVGAAGRHVAMHSARFLGYVELDKNVTAVVKTIARVADAHESHTFSRTFTGPLSESYEASDVVDQPVFSAIPGDSVILTLHTQIRVDNSKNKKGSGLLTTDFTTHKATAAYGLKWQS